MMKREFEKLIGEEIPSEDWDIINFVYTWHPCILDVGGKEQVAKVYSACRIAPFRCMMDEADQACKIDAEIFNIDNQIKMLQKKKSELFEKLDNLK